MGHVVIPKTQINDILNSLIKEYRLVAPVRDGSTLLFNQISDARDIVLSDEITYKSPKEFVFPQTEKLMVFDKNGEIKSNEDTQKTIIFGIRPCDLEALKIMTAVFTKGKYIDTYFEKRLNNTIIIGMGCISEKPSCFCSERGIDMGSSSDCDIFLNDDGENYFADVISERGSELLKGFNLQYVDSPDNIKKEIDNKEILEIQADEKELFEKIDWDTISEKCLGCGTCTYICPTCHCFEFKDVEDSGEKIRYRCWDSCMYPKFTLHASGHNPRSSRKERYRQRIMHKYIYVKKNFGYTACTGCGRCIRSCPAGMNIKSVVKQIMEEIK